MVSTNVNFKFQITPYYSLEAKNYGGRVSKKPFACFLFFLRHLFPVGRANTFAGFEANIKWMRRSGSVTVDFN